MYGSVRRPWVLFVCVFVLSLPGVTGRIYSSDEIQYFSFLRSLWFDHDLSFENEYQHFFDRRDRRLGRLPRSVPRTADGHRAAHQFRHHRLRHPVDAVLRRRRCRGPRQRRTGRRLLEAVHRRGGLRFGLLRLRQRVARDLVRAAAWIFSHGTPGLLVALGTPLLFYMYVAPPFSHACSAFSVALFITVWLRVRDSWSAGGLIALGLSAALMAMVREQDAFFAAGPALDLAIDLSADERAVTSALAGIAAGGARVHPPGRRLHTSERPPRAARVSRQQDVVVRAARAAGAALAGARLLRLDTARRVRARRPGRRVGQRRANPDRSCVCC